MDQTIKLLGEFEKRNNISASVVFHSDASACLQEFWDAIIIKSFENIKELQAFLKTGELVKDEHGSCVFPIKII